LHGSKIPYEFYLEQARENLIKTVEQFKNIHGKTDLDQRILIREEY